MSFEGDNKKKEGDKREGGGVKRIVYGLKKVSPWAVETEGGKLIRRPGPPFPADCRGCSLLDLVCEELEHPCPGITDDCAKHAAGVDCEECEKLAECLDDRPCCWECKHLLECLERAKGLVQERFGCDWGEFLEAVKMLLEDEK